MRSQIPVKALFIICAILVAGCAQVAPLTGGPRDSAAPKLISADPPQATVSFSAPLVSLRFNEYVQLKDLRNQLIITPSMKTEPEITAEGKTVRVKLKPSELLPNTTYKIQFGRSIADMTEGNLIPDFQYVFSTGNSIDTLKIKGEITDAETGKPAADVVIALYPETADSDSIVYKRKPEYLGRSKADGSFLLNYLPAKTFLLYAFRDKNKNLLYDGESEQTGFYPGRIRPGEDSAVSVALFQEKPSRNYIRKTYHPYYGQIQIIYNSPSRFSIKSLRPRTRYFEKDPGISKDTVRIFYHTPEDSISFLIRRDAESLSDTIHLRVPRPAQSKKIVQIEPNTAGGLLPFGHPLSLRLSHAPDTLSLKENAVRLNVKTDSGYRSVKVNARFRLPDKIILMTAPLKGDYELKIDTAFIRDQNSNYNDSVYNRFRTQLPEELGKLNVQLSVNTKQNYLLQVLNEARQTVRQESVSYALSSESTRTISFSEMPPGNYSLRVIYDSNANGAWDTGNLTRRKQPERIYFHSKQIKILPDWEVEEAVRLK